MLTKLLSTRTTQLGRAGRFAVFQIKLWSHCIRLLRVNRAGQQAAALSYQTIFGIVPLAIVMLLIFQALPAYSDLAENMKSFAYNWAGFSTLTGNGAEGEQRLEAIAAITERIDTLVTGFFAGTHKGSITVFSVLLVIWAAFGLLSTIEKAFNNIWHIGTGRSFLHRIINYWAVMTLGPLLVAAGIYAVSRYWDIGPTGRTVTSDAAVAGPADSNSTATNIVVTEADQSPEGMWSSIMGDVAPLFFSYAVATVMFFLLYFILPNTKVRAGAAIWGAAVAALVWIGAKNVYGLCVTEFKLYSTVYGALALVPITVMWIYLTWLFVLFGLQLTFTTQHLKSLDAAEIVAAKKTEDYFIANDLTAINIVREIAAAFEQNKAPVEGAIICSKVNIPGEFGDKILNHLVSRGIIVKTSEPKVGFAPARDPANIMLSDISAAVAEAGFAQSSPDQPAALDQIARSRRDLLGRYNLKQILGGEQS
ncbi:MAG: YhjD/YihY/BrkB family envelope integrity protein [Planctomycetota bacterium]|jgi:membrane protein